VVGGDIFWQSPKRADGMFWVALVDCTGHGVPGAMVSMLVASALNRLWETHNDLNPGEVLGKLGDLVRQALNQDSEDAKSNDGFDSAIVRIEPASGVVNYAGARIGLFVVPREHEPVLRINGFKMALGYKGTEPHAPLPNTELKIHDVAAMVMATDGVFDQPGGANGRAFGPTRLADFLAAHRNDSASELARKLQSEMTHWRGDQSRRDDLSALVLGF
jgi:serine phosphatase RsbU (regulator of sigma subunit)